jgi:hypothetical protein
MVIQQEPLPPPPEGPRFLVSVFIFFGTKSYTYIHTYTHRHTQSSMFSGVLYIHTHTDTHKAVCFQGTYQLTVAAMKEFIFE